MRTPWIALVLIAAAAGAAVAGPPLRLRTSVGLAPVVEGGAAHGSVRLTSDVRRAGRERIRVVAEIGGLDVTQDGGGHLPEFRLALTPPEGDTADLGALVADVRGRARLRIPSASRALGERPLRSFEGGTLEVRRNGTTVLSAPVPRLDMEGAGTSSSLRRVFGRLDNVDPTEAPGTWLAVSLRDGSGVHGDRVAVVADHVDTLPSTSGAVPVYRVFVADAAGSRVVGFGNMDLEQTFGATLHADQTRGTFPAGVATIEEFDRGRIEVRLANNATILRGHMPPFPAIADRPLPGRSASSRGTEELVAPEGGSARALADARRTVYPARVSETFTLRATGLDPAAAPFWVTAVDGGGTQTTLGSLRVDGAGGGRLSLSTARGGVPAGLPWLSGQGLEVRSAAGGVVLSGTFPTIE